MNKKNKFSIWRIIKVLCRVFLIIAIFGFISYLILVTILLFLNIRNSVNVCLENIVSISIVCLIFSGIFYLIGLFSYGIKKCLIKLLNWILN